MLGFCLLIWLLLPVCENVADFSPVFESDSEYYDYEFVLELARLSVARHRFETVITFASNRKTELPPAQHDFVDSFESLLVRQLKLPIIIWGLSANTNFRHIITHKTLVFATIEHCTPKLLPLLDVLHKTLDGRHNVYILFIVKQLSYSSPTELQLKEFFSWCWLHNFVNVALTFQQRADQVRNELFSYTPFPKVEVLNVTSFGVDYEWPYFNPRDVKGYEFRIPYFFDPPFTYLFSDGKLRGFVGSHISEYITHINGVAKLEFMPDVNRDNYYDKLMMLAANGEIDFGVNPFTSLKAMEKVSDGAFSFELSRFCLIVPWVRSSVLQSYFGHCKDFNHLFFIIVVIVPIIWQIRDRQVFKGLYLGLVIYFLQSLDSRTFKKLPRLYKFIHLSMLMAVLIMTTLKSGNLSATLSVQPKHSQINTVDDFLKSNIPLMLTKTLKHVFIDSGAFPEKFKDRLEIVDLRTLFDHIDKLNNSYSYITLSTYTETLIQRQRYLLHPLLRVVDGKELCTAPHFQGVPIQFNSPFKESLMRFRVNTLSTGVRYRWRSHTKKFMFRSGIYSTPRDEEMPFAIVTLNDVELLLKIYGIAVMSCVLCLLLEILWMRYTDWRKRVKQK